MAEICFRRLHLMTDVEVGWLAGVIDGEGCICIAKQPQKTKEGYPIFMVRLFVTNTCKELLDRCYQVTGVGHVRERYKSQTRVNKRQPCYHWDVSKTKDVIEVLQVVHPHLIAKSRQAQLGVVMAMTFKRNNTVTAELTEWRERVFSEMQALLHPSRIKAGEFGESLSQDETTPSQASVEEGVEISPEIMDPSARPERDDMIRAITGLKVIEV